MGGDHVVAQVALQHQLAHLVQRARDRLDLFQDVDAVDGVVLEHAQDPLHMPLDRKQAPAGILARRGRDVETLVRAGLVHPATSAW